LQYTPCLLNKGLIMEHMKQAWSYIVAHKKVSIAVAVVVVILIIAT